MGDGLGDRLEDLIKKLTARFVETINKPGKYYDGNGLFLRVYPAGSRNWVQRVTIKGKRKELGLGNANLISLADIREKAIDNLRSIKNGNDPTLKNVFPHFGHIKVNEITSSNLLSALQPIWLSKPETARRIRQRIGVVLKWCIANEWRRDNPADNISEGLPKQPKKKDHRKSISYTEVGNFISSLKEYTSGLIPKLALEFLILTATRPIETRLASWKEIDDDLWIIPGERMKAGITHRIPLSSRCLEILNEAKKLSDGSNYIFYGYKPNVPLSENIFMNLINNLNIEVHSHGFRTSFRTWTQEKTNYPNKVAEAALAHKLQDKAEAAYARSDLLEKRREMMQAWCDYIIKPEAKIILIRG